MQALSIHRASRRPLAAILGFAALACLAAPSRTSASGLAERAEALDAPWLAYLRQSDQDRGTMEAALQSELASADLPEPLAAPRGKPIPFDPERPLDWYRSDPGAALVRFILSYQTPLGGWSKNIDAGSPPRAPRQAFAAERRYLNTFDNGATNREIRHLARAYRATGDERARAGAERGLRFILRSQFPNGGWPQIYPLAGGYHDLVTYNDEAVANTLNLLLDAASGQDADFSWVSDALRGELAQTLEAGVAGVLASQVEQNGALTGWGQQHDPLTLAPADGRDFEKTSLASSESAGLLEFLMRLPGGDAEVERAIDSGIAWLEKIALRGVEYERPAPGEPAELRPGKEDAWLWARFYEIGSGRPIFGDRDGSVHYELGRVSRERRGGYGWYTEQPLKALKRYRREYAFRERAARAPPELDDRR